MEGPADTSDAFSNCIVVEGGADPRDVPGVEEIDVAVVIVPDGIAAEWPADPSNAFSNGIGEEGGVDLCDVPGSDEMDVTMVVWEIVG